MCAFSLALDKLRMTSPAVGLEISFDSSISFQSSERSYFSLDRTELLDLLCSGNVWVTRGRGLRLNFTIHSNGKPPGQSSWASITENLGHYLRDAPLWSQVSLDARFVLPQSDGQVGIEHCFSICLQHALSGTTSCQTSDPLLSAAASIQAPGLVPCLEMKKVDIILSVRPTRNHVRGSSNGVGWLTGQGHKAKEECHFVLDPMEGDLFWYNSPNLAYATCFIPNNYFNNFIYGNRGLLDVVGPSPVESFLPQSASSSHPAWNSGNEDTKDKFSINMTHSSVANLTCAQKMAELALQNLIGGSQTKSHPGIKIMKPRPAQSLSRIAPALWSPGFLQAMSQRSRFLPTISHTISNAFLQNVQSPSLKRKLISLASNQERPAHNDAMIDDLDFAGRTSSSDTETAPNLREVIEGRLWTMMQLSLYDPLAARRLFSHPADTDDKVEPAEEAITDAGMDQCSSQQSEGMQHQETDMFSFLADDFDDRPDGILSETDYDDFEALLEDDLYGPQKNEFEDLFEMRQPLFDNSTDDATLEDYDMDIDMAAHDGSESRAFAPEIRHRPASVEPHFEGWDTQIDNQSMLV